MSDALRTPTGHADRADDADRADESVDVLVVGGGPSGLAAAAQCAALGLGSVVVLEREADAGGIPRHSHHTGYGLRDLHRVTTGPQYAQSWVERAEAAGGQIRTTTMVTELDATGPRPRVHVTSPEGRTTIAAHALVLATGCRERPRSARLVPGDRPAGVFTTGSLQQWVYLEGMTPGTRAVVVGTEHVSYSALLTLQQHGCDVVAMVTHYERPTTFGAFRYGAEARWRVPVLAQTRIERLNGRERVQSVDVVHAPTGRRRSIDCDTVVFTGDWVADHELPWAAGLAMDAASTGPRVDAASRTSAPGVFAVGNLTHPAETADVCAVGGRHVADRVADWLLDASWPASGVEVTVADPLVWVTPSLITDATMPARGRLVLRAEAFRRAPWIQVTQADRVLWRRPVPWLVPTRPLYVPTPWLSRVDHRPGAAPVWVTVR
jgi:thioredoxin reductase